MTASIIIPKVAVVIPTWNRKLDLINAIRSVKTSTYPSIEIIVVDNGSTDGSEKAVLNEFSDVCFVRLKENKGAAYATNRGLEIALSIGAVYIFRMDSDVTTDFQTINELVHFAQTHKNVGLVYPKVLRFDNPGIVWFKGASYHPLFLISGTRKSYNQPDDFSATAEKKDYIASAAVLMSRAVIETIGLYDELFFVYGEDTDYCLRTRQAGFDIYLLPSAKAWHKIGSEKLSDWGTQQWFRGMTIFYMKHSHGLHRTFLRFYLLSYALLRAFVRKPKVDLKSAIVGIELGLDASGLR